MVGVQPWAWKASSWQVNKGVLVGEEGRGGVADWGASLLSGVRRAQPSCALVQATTVAGA